MRPAHWVYVACVGAALFTRYAVATPLLWDPAQGGNGHYYELVTTKGSYVASKTAAAAKTFQGVNGHLATLTSDAERLFVVENLRPVSDFYYPSQVWIGGEQAAGSTTKDGGWSWVTGEPWQYTHWAPFEPNDLDISYREGGREQYLCIYLFNPSREIKEGLWNDERRDGGAGNIGYYVEYPVPEPSSACATLGALVLLMRRRRRN